MSEPVISEMLLKTQSQQLKKKCSGDSSSSNLAANALSAAGVAFLSAVIVNPLDVAKGEALAFLFDDLQKFSRNGYDLCRITAIVGDTKYVIGDLNDSTLSVGGKVFDKSLEKWVYPTVLCTKPPLASVFWALPVGEDWVFVIKNGAITDDNH